MSAINIVNAQVIFTDNYENKHILLNMHDFLLNKSRIPMHSFEENGLTITNFLSNLIHKNEMIIPNLTPLKKLQYITLDTLIAAEFIKSSAPVKIAEFGCTNGELSYNLMELCGKFNPNSLLCLISNTIGNNSDNNCLDFITQAESFSEFSMIYSDYTKTNLADNTFDFVIINGDVTYENPYNVIKEAERITTENGIIFCCSFENYLLTSTFQLIFSNRKEYIFTNTANIMTTRKINTTWKHQKDDFLSNLSTLIDSIKNEIRQENYIDTYRKYVKQLHSCIDNTIVTYDIKRKLELIQIKENLLDYMNCLNLNTLDKNFYENKLLESLSNIKL